MVKPELIQILKDKSLGSYGVIAKLKWHTASCELFKKSD